MRIDVLASVISYITYLESTDKNGILHEALLLSRDLDQSNPREAKLWAAKYMYNNIQHLLSHTRVTASQ